MTFLVNFRLTKNYFLKTFFIFLLAVGSYYLVTNSKGKVNEDLCDLSYLPYEEQGRCVDGYFYGSWRGAGMGNRIFEFVTFMGLAHKSQRLPSIADNRTIYRLRQISKWFPNIDYELDLFKERTCNYTKEIKVNAVSFCCKVDQKAMKAIKEAENISSIHLHTAYTQGVSYISKLPSCYVRKLLRGSPSIINTAEKELFPPVYMREYKKNLCIHLRRGDFHKSSDVFPADQDFTLAATRYILNKELYDLDVYVFGDDQKFNKNVFTGWMNVYIASVDKNRPPNVEWEFSRLYCDIFLLPSSASTYGWWAAYLSRGQRVFFNANYSRPTRGIAKQLNPWEFWPFHWQALNLSNSVVNEVKVY